MVNNSGAAASYRDLTPDLILDAVDGLGFRTDGRLLPLNSYENRVYQIGIEDAAPLIAKFYRPGRWFDEAIMEEHCFAAELAGTFQLTGDVDEDATLLIDPLAPISATPQREIRAWHWGVAQEPSEYDPVFDPPAEAPPPVELRPQATLQMQAPTPEQLASVAEPSTPIQPQVTLEMDAGPLAGMMPQETLTMQVVPSAPAPAGPTPTLQMPAVPGVSPPGASPPWVDPGRDPQRR